MEPFEIVSSIIGALAFIVSCITAYRTFFSKFEGNVWMSNRIVLAHVEDIPSLGIACFFENRGARSGTLDDLRVKVTPIDSGSSFFFYPILMRNDYSIFREYTEADWFPFSMINLTPNSKSEKYLLLKPLNDHFLSSPGEIEVSLEVRWYKKDNWEQIMSPQEFKFTDEICQKWNNPREAAYQLSSNDLRNYRR